MIRLPDGFSFWRGLVFGVVGAFLVAVGFILTFMTIGGEAPWWFFVVFLVGLGTLVFGPLWYWIGRPLVRYRRKRRVR